MQRYFFSKKSIFIIFVSMLLLLVIARKNKNAALPNNKSNVTWQYRTTYSNDSCHSLIAYTFYIESSDNSHARYSAIIKTLNNKDDYKILCRSIIFDIIKTVGSNEIEINIYDNDTARELFEKSENQFYILNENELSTIKNHLITTYYGNVYHTFNYGEDDEYNDGYIEYHENYVIYYYPKNIHIKKEKYKVLP